MTRPDNNYIEVYQDIAGEWRWRKKSPNGEITATSGEAFDERSNAIEAAEREAAGSAEVRVAE